MPIQNLEKFDLPREKLFSSSPASLKDEELLAIILGTGYKGKDVLALSKEILQKHRVEDLVNMTPKELKKIKGIGMAKASIIAAANELAIRGRSRISSIKNPSDILPLVTDIRAKKKEHFVVFYLNARNEVIHKEFVSIGTLSSSLVHPREVFKSAIEHSAASIICVHNHPSGDITPSEDDIKLTKRLVSSGLLLGIEVLDHIIITETDYNSMKSLGIL